MMSSPMRRASLWRAGSLTGSAGVGLCRPLDSCWRKLGFFFAAPARARAGAILELAGGTPRRSASCGPLAGRRLNQADRASGTQLRAVDPHVRHDIAARHRHRHRRAYRAERDRRACKLLLPAAQRARNDMEIAEEMIDAKQIRK